jgi:hypothetical protein
MNGTMRFRSIHVLSNNCVVQVGTLLALQVSDCDLPFEAGPVVATLVDDDATIVTEVPLLSTIIDDNRLVNMFFVDNQMLFANRLFVVCRQCASYRTWRVFDLGLAVFSCGSSYRHISRKPSSCWSGNVQHFKSVKLTVLIDRYHLNLKSSIIIALWMS